LFIGVAIGNLCVRVLAIGIEKRHLFGQCKVYPTKGGAARLNSPSLAYPKNIIVLLFRNTLKSEWYLESSHHKYFLKFNVKKSLVIGKYDFTHAVCQEHALQTPPPALTSAVALRSLTASSLSALKEKLPINVAPHVMGDAKGTPCIPKKLSGSPLRTPLQVPLIWSPLGI